MINTRSAARAFDFLCRLAADAKLDAISLSCKGGGGVESVAFRPGDPAAQEWIALRTNKRIDCATGTASGKIRVISATVPRLALGQVLAFRPAPSIIAETATDYAVAWRMHFPQTPSRAIQLAHQFAEALGGKPLAFTFPVPGAAGVALVRHLIGFDSWALAMIEGSPEDQDGDGPLIIPAASIKAKPVKWLWPDVISFSEPGPGGGAYFLLAGAEKMGKSTLAAQIAAIVTCGGTWPTGEHAPRGSIAIGEKEDSAATVTIPRMQAAGADMSKVHIVKPCDLSTAMGKFASGLELAEDLKLLVLSPWVDFFGKSDTRNDAVRAKVRPLQDWAARRGVAVLGIIHLADKDGKDHMALTGSAAWKQAARGVWSLIFDPSDKNPVPYDRRRLMVCGGTNVGTGSLKLPYRIESAVTPEGLNSSRVVFLAKTEDAADRNEIARLELGKLWLTEFLVAGPRTGAAVKKAALDAGISYGTLDRASRILNIVKTDIGGKSPEWTLPRT